MGLLERKGVAQAVQTSGGALPWSPLWGNCWRLRQAQQAHAVWTRSVVSPLFVHLGLAGEQVPANFMNAAPHLVDRQE